MSFKTVGLLILVLLALGSGGAFYYVFQQRQAESQAAQLLYQAQALMQEGSMDRAVSVLADVVERYPKFSNLPQVLLDLGRAYEPTEPEQALAAWERLVADFPNSSAAKQAHRAAGMLYLKQEKLDQAETHFNALAGAVEAELRSAALLGQGAVAQARGDKDKARQLYYQVIENSSSPKEIADEARNRLGPLNTELLFSPSICEFSQRYEVQPGDNMISIAARFGTTAYLIREMNRMSTDHLRAGMRITVPHPGGVRLVISKSGRYLDVFSRMEGTEGKFIKRYPVGVAKYAERTPVGIYVIQDKSIDPTWYPPEGGIIPPGDPRNALGTRWMGFSKDGRDTSLGIHGNNAPETIGTSESAGCIRMYNPDVEELFMIARQGTEVEIIE